MSQWLYVWTVLRPSWLFHQWLHANWHQDTEPLETLGQAIAVETALSFSLSDNRARRKSFTSYPAFQRKKVPFQEISHFNSIKFSKLKPRLGPSERQGFYTARNRDSAVFFPKTKTMSSQHNQLNQHPWIENKTLSFKHNYTIKFLANGLVKTLILLEWKHKPQRERDGETETEERNKDQLHKPFSCFSLSKAGEAAGPLRHLHVSILFSFFFFFFF